MRMRSMAAVASLSATIAAMGVACSSETQDKPTETISPSTSGTPPSSGSASPSPTEKSMSTNGPNSFSPQVKAPTPFSPRPADCLPDWC